MSVVNVGIPGEPATNLTAWQGAVRDVLGSSDVPVAERLPRDTGWRNISALLQNSFTGLVRIRRVGWTVTLLVSASRATAVTVTPVALIGTCPAGFERPGTDAHSHLWNSNSGAIVANSVAFTGAAAGLWLAGQNLAANQTVDETWVWTTTSPWPTTLPGVPG